MKLRLIRTIKGKNYTAGSLYLKEGDREEFVCNTLEDKWRDLKGVLGKKEEKVYGETCIPEGEYEVVIAPSPKYINKIKTKKYHPLAFTGGYMPRILNVPQFSGVLVHTGNFIQDTMGCVLLGERDKNYPEMLKGGSSLPAFKKFYEILRNSKDKITIEICSMWV